MITQFTNPHKMYRTDKPTTVRYVEQGIVLPQKTGVDYPMWGLGGVCDQDNDFVELSFYDGGWASHGGKYTWTEEEYLDCTAVYFGVFFKHWGHFLIDLIGRMWYFAQNHGHKNVRIAYLGEEEPDGNFLQFFELLGIQKHQLLHITKPTRFREVIIPEFSCKSCAWYTMEYQSIFDAIVQKVESEPPSIEVPEKVYFSRLNFRKAKDTEFGEQHLADWLSANGYVSICPEQLNLCDQVYIWNHAKQIACLDGTIPLNMFFCRKQELQLLVMHKTHLEHQNLDLALLMRPCHVVLLDVYYEPFKKYPTSIGAGPFLLCISDDVLNYSASQNLKMPFTKAELKQQLRQDYCRLIWRIINLKGKVRGLASRTMPKKAKAAVRKILGCLKKK